MSYILDNLNDRQEEAVLSTEGPVMVIAGAGSGKTNVLTRRIAYIISELGVDPRSILAVTFTNKAAREMKERIANLIGGFLDNEMWISTFHSFCARFLRIEARYLGGFYTSDFQILDEEDSLRIVKELIKEKKIYASTIKPQTIRSWISKSKNFEDYCLKDDLYQELLNDAIEEYDNYLAQNNALDFDDLLIKTIKILRNNPEVREKYQNKFKYVLVDEFQDTNKVQFDLICLLANKEKNVFIVGDEDQSIYSFRGALVTNIQAFRRHFVGTKTILLEENYRSTKPILDLANKVIQNNTTRIEKKLFTKKVDGNRPYFYYAENRVEEATFVVNKIEELLKQGYKYSDFAVLYRINYISRSFEDVFVKRQMPYIIYGGLSFFARKEIKDLVAYLRLILNHDDNISFNRIVNEPKRKIGPGLLADLLDVASSKNISLFKAIDYMGNRNLDFFKDIILNLREDLTKKDLTNFFDDLLNKTGYWNYLVVNEEEDRQQNVLEFRSVLLEAQKTYGGSNINTLSLLLSDLALRTDTDEKRDTDEVIKMMSLHQAKGLEFKVVFLVALEEGVFPCVNGWNDTDIEEERRICYVGITRAQKLLYLSASRFVNNRGVFLKEQLSRFIYEMDLYKTDFKYKEGSPKKAIYSTSIETKKEEVKKIEQKFNHPYVVGDKVMHRKFGSGLVVQADKDFITVAFGAPHGLVKLLGSHEAITKIEKKEGSNDGQ